MHRPNLFKIATKELSHDAVLTWLFQWAHPSCKEVDLKLHECGKGFLNLFLNESEKSKGVTKIEAGRQWEHIDVWACVYFSDGDKLLIIIENKTFAGEHGNQLENYKKFAAKWAKENEFRLSCFFTKIGSQSLRFNKAIEAKGYKVIDRNAIVDCLKGNASANAILSDYLQFLQGIEAEHLLYETLPMNKWEGWQWVGFFQFIERQIDIIQWHFVNNLSGGFWNLCLTWECWHSVPVYMQMEQDKLCFKIALGEYETGLDNSQSDIDAIQDAAHVNLLKYAADNGFSQIKRPGRLVHKGDYRTIAIINGNDWLGAADALVDKEKVMTNVHALLVFYYQFVKHLNATSFEDAGIKIEYQLEKETPTTA